MAKTQTKKAASGKTITVVQTGSLTKLKSGMAATLAGLGLGKPNRRKELVDSPAVRGMIRKVRHVVKVEGEE